MKFVFVFAALVAAISIFTIHPDRLSANESRLLVRTNGEHVYFEAIIDDHPGEVAVVQIRKDGLLLLEEKTDDKGVLTWTAPGDGEYEAKAVTTHGETTSHGFRIGQAPPIVADQSTTPPISQTLWFKAALIGIGLFSFLGCVLLVRQNRTPLR